MLAAAASLLRVTSFAGFDPSCVGAFLAATALLLLTLLFWLSSWSGGSGILQANGRTFWSSLERAVFIALVVPVLLLVILMPGETQMGQSGNMGNGDIGQGPALLEMIIFPLVILAAGFSAFALSRGIQLTIWGAAAALPTGGKPSHLTAAKSGRLMAAGLLTIMSSCFAAAVCFRTLFLTKHPYHIRKSFEGETQGSLGEIRSALDKYHETGNQYPSDLAALTINGNFLKTIPPANVADYHRASAEVRYGKVPDDAGGWLYNNEFGDVNVGSISVNCTHTDSKGSVWSSY